MKSILVFVLCLFHATLFAQGPVSGKIVDEKAQPVRFANVRLLKTTNMKPVANGLADSSGFFSITVAEPGNYFLQVTAIGFTKFETDSFLVAANFSKDLGVVTLKTDARSLENVTVTSLRPTITQLADKMVVTIEGTAMAGGNTAFNVLSKSPGVFIDHEGNIQLNGRAGVTVMIDGRLTHLSATDLRNLLESMSAENIKSIEIITNPSSKYDAEGTSGIINIVLKKNTFQGINGSLNAAYSYNWKQSIYSTGGSINFKRGNWNSSLNVDFNHRAGGRDATFTRIFYGNKTTYFDQVATGNFEVEGPPSVRFITDYDITKKHSVGITLNYVTNTAVSDFLTDTYLSNTPNDPFQYIDANNYNQNRFRSVATNFHYINKLDTAGTILSTDLDYANIKNRGEGNYYNTYFNLITGRDSIDNLYTNTPNGYQIYAAKIDLTHPFKKTQKLEAGLKASHVTSDNDSRFYFNNSGLVLDPSRTNHFYYEEDIYAAYLNWNTSLGKKTTIQTGLRAEQTVSKGNQLTTGQVNSRTYLDFFPTFFIQQNVSDRYGINFNYSRRLSRPGYGGLNPFRAYRDPYTYTVGNPDLRPQYTHAFTVSQTFHKKYILNLYYNLTKDVMAEIPILDVAKAVTVYTTGNVDNSYNTGMTAIAPIKITNKWDTRNTVQLSYSKFNTYSNVGAVENKQLFFLFQSAHTILLPKDFRFEMSFLYRGPAASGLYHMAAMNWVDAALKKSFAKKKFELTISANDIFKGYRYLWSTNIGGNKNDFDQYFRFNTIGASIRYNFSKGQNVNVKQRKGPEELDRT